MEEDMANQKTPGDRPQKQPDPAFGGALDPAGSIPPAGSSPQASTAGEPAVGVDADVSRAVTLENVQQAAAEVYQKLAETAGQLSEQARQLYDSSQAYVREHPGPSLIGAFAVGVLVGWLSDRLD
jgi:ElaB/YqjD/DUF883 family membrane-anchored ribosome-binding protein